LGELEKRTRDVEAGPAARVAPFSRSSGGVVDIEDVMLSLREGQVMQDLADLLFNFQGGSVFTSKTGFVAIITPAFQAIRRI
jgi:hypothetical protein